MSGPFALELGGQPDQRLSTSNPVIFRETYTSRPEFLSHPAHQVIPLRNWYSNVSCGLGNQTAYLVPIFVELTHCLKQLGFLRRRHGKKLLETLGRRHCTLLRHDHVERVHFRSYKFSSACQQVI